MSTAARRRHPAEQPEETLSDVLLLTGYVLPNEDGMYVAEFHEVPWSTYAKTQQDLILDIPDMITDYLQAYAKAGKLTAELARLRVRADQPLLKMQVIVGMPEGARMLSVEYNITFPLGPA